MTRTPIPPSATQSAINAMNECRRISTALTTSATFHELVLADAARNRALDALRALGPQIRAAKSAVRHAEKRAEIDRRIIERDRASVSDLGIPA